MNGVKYSNFLQNDLPLLLEDVPLQQRRNIWYQQDGCPAHYSILARTVLNAMFNDKWIGRGGPVNWPPRSPDLTCLDFFLWGYLKEIVYHQVPTTPEDMKQRIKIACREINNEIFDRVHNSFVSRILKCIEVDGQQFEHML